MFLAKLGISVLFNHNLRSFPGGASGREPACQYRRQKRYGFSPWVGKIPWRKVWQPTPILLPGESHEEPASLQFMGSGRVGHDWRFLTRTLSSTVNINPGFPKILTETYVVMCLRHTQLNTNVQTEYAKEKK